MSVCVCACVVDCDEEDPSGMCSTPIQRRSTSLGSPQACPSSNVKVAALRCCRLEDADHQEGSAGSQGEGANGSGLLSCKARQQQSYTIVFVMLTTLLLLPAWQATCFQKHQRIQGKHLLDVPYPALSRVALRQHMINLHMLSISLLFLAVRQPRRRQERKPPGIPGEI